MAAVAVCLVFGWLTLQRAPEGRVRVGLAVTDATVASFETEDRDEAMAVVRAYASRVEALAAQGAEIVVLPEKFVSVHAAWAQETRATLALAARNARVTLVAGLNERPPAGPLRNLAVVFSPEGEILAEYSKQHLLPGPESGYERGSRDTRIGRLGVAICKDMDFPDLGRRQSRAGAGLLLVPAWDFVKDARLHGHMAILRGIEGGYAIARTAQEGLMTVTDAHGRIVAERASFDRPEVLLVADVGLGPGRTIYSRMGDAFGWVAVALGTVLLLAAGLRGRRPDQ